MNNTEWRTEAALIESIKEEILTCYIQNNGDDYYEVGYSEGYNAAISNVLDRLESRQRTIVEENAHKEPKVCPNCSGVGWVQISPNVRGIKKCFVCEGYGTV